VVTSPEDTSVADIAKLMRRQHVGSVVVTRGGGRQPAGIVTDRDIVVEVLAMGLDPSTLKAADIMTAAPILATQDEDVLWALKVMRDRGVRRLPVVDAAGEVAGMLALDDLMQHLGNSLGDVVQLIGTERSVEAARRAG
jgi:CBS domain-containing protein